MDDPDETFQKLCLEAVRACGTNMEAIERYVFKEVGAMDPTDRDRIARNIKRIISFQPPGFHENGPH